MEIHTAPPASCSVTALYTFSRDRNVNHSRSQKTLEYLDR